MISAKVKAMVSRFRGQPLVYSKMCNRCGDCDDPESASRWPDDEDGDRICRECAEKEGVE